MPIDVNGNSINSLGTRLFNSTEIVSNGLVWYYDAGIADSYAGSGTSIVDFTGNGNNSTLSDFSYVNTFGGSFENTTSRNGSPGIQVPLTNFSKLVGTCEFWVRPTTFLHGNGMFVNRADDVANASDWWWFGIWDSGNRIYLRLGNSAGCCGNDNSPVWTGVHPINTWGHYALTWNSGVESKIYFNGVLNSTVSITTIPNSNPSSTGRWGLGHNTTNSQWLGQMGTFKHYNRVLSAAEVLQNYQADRTRFGK
jgi:hypothetical protein